MLQIDELQRSLNAHTLTYVQTAHDYKDKFALVMGWSLEYTVMNQFQPPALNQLAE